MNQEAFDFTASILVERLGLRRESALKMAAAHSMYDALKRVVAQYEDRCGDHCSNFCVICQARAAIQKAEGAQ